MKLQLIFKWYDFWIGFFWDSKNKWLYFFPIPMFGMIFKFIPKKNKCDHDWKKVVYRNEHYIYHCLKCHEEIEI
jgi:hypothetical protein